MRIKVLTLGLLVAFAMLTTHSRLSEADPYEIVRHIRRYTCETASGTRCVTFYRSWTTTSTPDDKTGSAHPAVHSVKDKFDYQRTVEVVPGDCDDCDS